MYPHGEVLKYFHSLTMICYVGCQKISLLPVGQAPKPPVVIVFVEHLDGITTADGEFI